jgi:ADP-heptose:LPS heptosyltransferase
MLFRSIIAFSLFQLLHLLFKRKKVFNSNILLIHTDGLGDLMYTYKLICNLDHIANLNFILIIKKVHEDLFADYQGNFKILTLDYDKYRFNIFYRLAIIRKLRNLNIKKVFQLNHNRRIVDDDLAINSGAKEIIALNKVEKNFPKVFKSQMDEYYDDILFYSPTETEYKIDFLLKEMFSINELKVNHIALNEQKQVRAVMSKIPGLMNKEYIVLNAFSSSKIRNLNVNQLNEVISYLTKRYNYKILLIGTAEQFKFYEEYSSYSKSVINVAGVTNIPESMVIVKNCKLFIGIDSGFTHIARYFDVPRVLIVGGGPYGLMITKESYSNEGRNEKLLFHYLDCFGCDWFCIHDKPLCLTKLDVSTIINTLNLFLSN